MPETSLQTAYKDRERVKGLGARWDPARKVWDSLYDTRLAVKLDAAQLVDFSGEAWAVGGNRVWHFTGAGWVAESLPATPAFSKTTALGVFAVVGLAYGRLTSADHQLRLDRLVG